MEFTGQQRTFGACNPLGVPALGPLEVDDDECEVVIGIRPKSSPLPRRRSSDSDEDWEAGPPPSGSRRVSFADAKGLSLVHVKEFDTWNVTKLPDYDSSEGRGSDAEVYFLSPLTFCLPSSTEELFARVRERKIELETIELLPGTTVLKGVIRVLNVSFSKAVYVRTTLDAWSSHFDLLAEYVPSSSDGATDRFSFKLAVVPPFGEPGARVDFCLRYETPSGTFWANNNDRNYVLFCQRRVGERKEMPLNERANNKSCLKTVGQSFSTGGNVAEMEASSTDDGAKVDSLKPEKTSNGPPAASEEDRQKLLAENRQNCSRRSGRKAARMARVRDYFSQRNVGVEDTKRDESPPEENQKAVQGETPRQKASDVQSLPEVSSESEGSHFVSESLETCSEPTVEVLHAASPPDTETENRHIARLPEEPAAAERQDNLESVSKADESSQRQSGKAEPEGSIESPDSRSNSFSFGTVVAPLYQQVFGRACHKSTWGNPVRATLHAGDSSYPHAASAQAGCTVRADAKGDEGKIQVIQSSNTECSVANRPPLGKDKTSSSVAANDIADHEQTLRDPGDVSHRDEIQTNTSEVPETISGDTTAHSHAANALKTDPPKPRKRAESSRPRGEAREDGGTRHAELPQRARARAKTAPHEATSAFRAPRPPELPRAPTSPTAACPQGGEASEALHASKPNDVRDSDTEETEIGCLSRLEKMEEKDTTENETSLEADGVEEEVAGVVINPAKEGTRLSAEREIGGGAEATTGDHTHGGALVQLQSEDARNVERRETDSKEQELCSADLAGVNRGTAVEEEEKNMLTDEEESLRTAGKERGPSEDAGRKTTAFEKRDTTETADEDVIFWEIKAARQKENKAQDADVAEGEEGGETRARKGREEAAKELKNTGAQEIKQEIKEKQEFDVERKNVQNKVTETHLSDGDQAGVGWEVRREEENPRHKVEIFVAETEGSEVTDAESEGATIEDGQSEESRSRATSDVTQNEVGAAPSALVNNVQDETVIDKENQHISTETQRCKESDCCFGEKAIIPEAVGAEEESAAPVLFAGEPENDPSGRESASAESDSDDEVELYMHCLRAVHAGGARADRNKDKSRPPASRGKLPPMPSISECQDEDRHRRDGEAAAAPEAADTKPSRWKETFSCGEISKILLLATLLAVFLVVAYRYDFLACLGLYLVSVVWLYCQGERQPKQQKNKTE